MYRYFSVRVRKRSSTLFLFAVLSAVGVPAVAGGSGPLNTVNWKAKSTRSSTGTGTLTGTAVTYLTNGNVNLAGETLTDDFDTSLATNNSVGTGVTYTTAGVLGAQKGKSSATEITFAGTVVDPILLVNSTDSGDSMDFGSLSITLLQSYKTSLSGDTISFTGSTNSLNDGFAIRINETFGPTNPLTFQYIGSNPGSGTSAFFTIGGKSTVAPEPGAMALLAGGVPLMGLVRRRRKTA